jgi:cell fate (sporulation/competence/biofilm development) regulator YlbF (YheA/YmcA/DUF963 family)
VRFDKLFIFQEEKTMDVISIARQLGAAIQQEDVYLEYQAAKAANDNDAALQDLIGEFNLLRMSLSAELQKGEEEKSQSKIDELNNQLQKTYTAVMENESMVKFNEAKGHMDQLTNRITSIIAMSIEGEDPEICEPAGCSGSCSTCGGCH